MDMYTSRRGPARASRQGPESAQAMVEFMLVLPIMLLIVMGIVEFGRIFAIYAMVSSASREASRYGASVGDNGSGVPRYLDCAGMREAARRVAVLSDLPDSNITITYDHGTTTSPVGNCDASPSPADIGLGDRVLVTVSQEYEPIVPLLPLPAHSLVSMSARSILKEIDAGPTATAGGPAATATPTDTPDPSITPTVTHTPTETLTPTMTHTATIGPSLTPTDTLTPFPTATPIPIPVGFTATVNCSNRKITFDWSPVGEVDYYAVYRTSPAPEVQVVIDSNPACNNCGVLPAGESSASFYVVAVVDGHESDPSPISTVSCEG